MRSFFKINSIVFVAILIFTTTDAWAKCGVYRWSIKTGSDQDIAKIDFNKKQTTTIESLINLAAPKNLPQASRLSPTETEVYQLQVTLLEVNQTNDSDYHLLIADSSGHQMIAEIPDPQCIANTSPVRAQIQLARQYIDQKIQVTGKPQKVNIPISLSGIGFFDMPHALGAAINGIELHPVLSVAFLSAQEDLFTTSEQKNVQTQNAIPNFLIVTENLSRGGRPNTGDLAALKSEKNITTVINLENKPPIIQQEKIEADRLGLKFISSPMDAALRPTDQQVNDLLAKLQDSSNFPIFLHCHHGQDRTGLIIGLYRVEVEGWTPAKAYQEMLADGFHSNLVALDKYFRDRTGYAGN